MDYDLGKKIDEYSEELYLDLGLTALPEEQKAELYARVQDHLHQVILASLAEVLPPEEVAKMNTSFEQEDYQALRQVLKDRPPFAYDLEEKIQKEFDQLKLTIAEEQKNAGVSEAGTPAGGGVVPI